MPCQNKNSIVTRLKINWDINNLDIVLVQLYYKIILIVTIIFFSIIF